MAKETRVEQVHPDHENAKIKAFEKFGWEVISSQRCQEQKGEYIYTFTKITFTRDKDAPWYNRVREIEKEYGDLLSCEYEEIKDKYGYKEIAGKAKEPIKPKSPNVADPSVFFKCLRFFIISAIITAIFIVLGNSKMFEYPLKDIFQLVSKIGMVVSGIGLFITLVNIQFLVGLRGEEKEKALKAYEKQLAKYKKEHEEFMAYETRANRFMVERQKELEKELANLIK